MYKRQVKDIPFGKTKSYGEVASLVGKPRAARAVGTILRNNPWPLFVPCHRVIGKNGKLLGYGGPQGVCLLYTSISICDSDERYPTSLIKVPSRSKKTAAFKNLLPLDGYIVQFIHVRFYISESRQDFFSQTKCQLKILAFLQTRHCAVSYTHLDVYKRQVIDDLL